MTNRLSLPTRHFGLITFLLATACSDCVGTTANNDPVVRDAAGIPGEARLACDYPSSLSGQALDAVAHGNAGKVDRPEVLVDAALATLKLQATTYDSDMATLFDLNADGSSKASSLTAISWDPTHDAVVFAAPKLGVNATVLTSNSDDKGNPVAERSPLAIFGRLGKTPYLAFASNPFRTTGNDQMQRFLVNSIRHLTNRPNGTPLRMILAQLDESYFFKDESATRAWLTEQFQAQVDFNVAKDCDGAKLDGCVDKGADLIIISQVLATGEVAGQIVRSVARALDQGIPVLYVQHDGSLTDLGTQLFEVMQIEYASDNLWHNFSVSNLDPSTLVGALNDEQKSLVAMLEHLKSGQYDFTLRTATTDQGRPAYEAQFHAGASVVRAMMNGFDGRAQDIFAHCGNEFPKILALLGDRYRSDTRYPLRVASTDEATFLRAYYADHAVLNVRSFAPAQRDRGSFDSRDLSEVVPVEKTVSMTSRRDFRSAGVYALPGRPMKVTRRDHGDVKLSVFINTLREGSTHEWDDGNYGGYSRPKFLRSAEVPLEPGTSVVITSVYGGPVQFRFDKNDVDVQVTFENIGEHPHWSSSADDERFAQGVASGTYNWIEVATDAFELHTTAEHFAGTMKDARWNTPAILATTIEKYTFDGAHVLAGFQGRGIDKVPEIFEWATSKGFDVPLLDLVKHANMDQPTCGDGCSGNPYDASWDFSPIGHGDLHEIGHSLQHARFQLSHGAGKYNYPNHAVTNWTPFYVANRYFDDRVGETSDWGVNHKDIFTALQNAYNAGERAGSFSSAMDKYFSDIMAAGGDAGIRDNYSFFMQAMMMARTKGKLSNGYHVVPRLHILEGAFGKAVADATTWDAAKAGLGFGSFTLDEAKALGNNDFMAVALSYVTGLDYRDFFDMFGLTVSNQTKAQIASFGFPAVERAFFALDELAHNHGALSSKAGDFRQLTIDGTTAWPLL